MAETTAFALRMPPELKEAAKALTTTSFCENIEGTENFRTVSCHSINDAIIHLMKTGVRKTLLDLDREIATLSNEMLAWQEIGILLLRNANKNYVIPNDFPPKSPARLFIEDMMNNEKEIKDRGEDLYWEFEDGIGRDYAIQELALCQKRLGAVRAAKGALQKAAPPVR